MHALDRVSSLFDPTGFVARAVCGNWTRGEVLLNNISDLLVALAYAAIPVMLMIFARRRKDFPMSWMSVVFALFILSCGCTHVLEIVLFYHPIYRLAGVVKAVTAVSSWFAVFALYKILPTALSLHSPTELESAKNELTKSHLQLQQRLADQNRELEDKNQQLFAANEAKSRFLANLSHELRTPMVGIIGLSELALADESWDMPESMAKIHRAALSQDSLLADLLEYSTVESGNLKLRLAPFTLREIFSDLAATLFWLAHDRGVTLTFVNDPKLESLHFQGDAARLRHVVMNLAQNALKFTEAGSVVVETACLELGPSEARFRCRVSDTGCGIPAHRLTDIFKPFVQVDESLFKRSAGSGLGLPLCQELLSLMGSQILVQSTLGEGSVFSFTLSLPVLSTPIPVAPVAGLERLKHARILLLEDNPINQKVLKAIMTKAHFVVTVADHGAAALKLMDEQEFDLGVFDLQLPDMDGLEVAQLARDRGVTMPFIALTAHGEPSYRSRALAAGLNDFLVKPVPSEDLLQAVCRALTGGSAEGADAPLDSH